VAAQPKLDEPKMDRAEKIMGFIEECKYLSKQTPGPKYYPGYKEVEPRSKAAKIHKESDREKKVTGRMLAVKKKKGVSPCDYNVLEAFNKS
jgi:hypothetical protein